MANLKQSLLSFLVAALVVGAGIGVYFAVSRGPEPAPVKPPPAPSATTAAREPEKPAASPDAAPLIRIYGTVTDAADGSPIDGAQVRLRGGGRDRDRDDDSVEPIEVITDAAGVYEARIDDDRYTSIVCVAPGYTRQRSELNTGGRTELRRDFTLVRGGTVMGKITDADTGDPIEGIAVELVGAQENVMERMRALGRDPSRRGESGPDGAYVLDGVPPGSYRAALGVRRSGYLYRPEDAIALEVEAGKTIENVDFSLTRGGTIVGRVIDETGAPIANAEVAAFPTQMLQRAMRRMSTGAAGDLGPNSDRTDETGEFSIVGLEYDDEYRLLAEAEGFAAGAGEPVRLPRGAAPSVTITLTRGSSVSGTARYAEGGPAAEVRVLLFPETGAGWLMFTGPRGTSTSGDGTFTIDHVPAGSYWLRAEGDFGGGISAFGRGGASNKAVRVDTDGKTDVTGLELILNKETPKTAEDPVRGGIKGTILREDGAPAPEVRVEAREIGGPPRSYGATTAADGSFELAGLRGAIYDLKATSELGIAQQSAVPVNSTVTLRLTPPATLSGYVVDPAGEPVPGCTVRLTNIEDSGKVGSFISVMQSMLGAEPGGKTTDADGRFEFTQLAAGSYVVKAQSASHGTAETSPMRVEAGDDLSGVRITLDPGVTVSGVVLGPAGEPVQGATVQLAPLTQDLAANLVSEFMPSGFLKSAGSGLTNANGEFSMSKIAPGAYRLIATHSAFAKSVTNDFRVLPGQGNSNVVIRMSKGGEARGTFTVDGKPQPGAMIVMVSPAGVELVQTDSQGRFQVTGLSAGPHMVAAFDPAQIAANRGFQFSPQVVDIADGQAIDVDLGGAEGVEVTGAVSGNLGTFTIVALRKPDGTPLEGLDLTNFNNLLESFRSLGGQTVVGPDGSFTLDNVPPGDYTLEVYSMDFDEANPDIAALLNLPRTPLYRQPIQIGADPQPIQIALP